MKITENVQKYWDEYLRSDPSVDPTTPFQVWYFGLDRESALELLNLVLEGKKTATASLPWEYEGKPEDAPILGGYSVVTDFDGEPMCVVRTTELRVVRFDEVDAEFAFDEGEGDQSLDYWRQVHWDYFTRRCTAIDREPRLDMPVNCERFEVLHPRLS